MKSGSLDAIIDAIGKPYFRDDAVVIYHADCRDILPRMPKVDLVLTDPPYGMSENSGRRLHAYKNPAKSGGRIGWQGFTEATEYGDTTWNHDPLDAASWASLQRVSAGQIVWGANHLLGVLGKPPRTLVWDKKCKNDWEDVFSDCEFGWCSSVGPDRLYRHLWMGAMRAGDNGKRVHPTQKPTQLMAWCLRFYPDAQTILDPFMGSGTTLRAAKDLGRFAIGIEIEEKYCETAAKRMAQGVLL
ncbi:hypothetical protein LCGC14_0676920 [marine sediment metagenome]|uniref:DNA methylase N-4/N-6 domain-containing protein n=1 Tax=marine sediment metagenome TaxID=412755 RepID=A0A0F9TAT6_9ZZZZ